MPLVRSFALSTKVGKETWVAPVVDAKAKTVSFEIHSGEGEPPEGTVGRRGAKCIVCGTAVPFDHIRSEAKAGRMIAQLMAIVAEGARQRVYLPPIKEHEQVAISAKPLRTPETDLPEKALGFRVQAYGMTKHRDLFTPRQLVALTTFSDLVGEARKLLREGKMNPDEETVLCVTGNGLKTLDALVGHLDIGVTIRPRLEEFEAQVLRTAGSPAIAAN